MTSDPKEQAPLDGATEAFLWDPKAPPVDDVVALQRALSPLSAASNAAQPPAVVRKPRARQLTMAASFAVAASIAASIALFVGVRGPAAPDVVVMDGADRRTVPVGERIDTTNEPAIIELGPHGVVTLAPGSQLSVVHNSRDAQELALERGSLSAIVVAPPRFFTVTTKAARAVDMGCAYELSVDEAGVTTLHVTSGFVSLEDHDDDRRTVEDVLVPAGASARARPNAPPSLPFRSDAPASLRALADARSLDVDALLAAADARDAITLWYAMRRLSALPAPDDAGGARVLARLLELSPPPSHIDVAALRAGDVNALQAWLDLIEDALTPWPTHAFP